jgi:ribonuclease R
VKPNDIIDKEAQKRATSVYLVDRVVPMLPEVLSNLVCSLRPNEDKLCMSAIFHITENGKVIREWFGKTIIRSKRRFTYEEAQEIIEGKDGDFKEEILKLHTWASDYRKKRIAEGALEFSGIEIKFKLDENGKPIGVYEKQMKEANFLIEEFMLLANRKVAQHIGKVKDEERAKTFVYRIHDLPDPDKLKLLQDFVAHLGYKLKSAKPENASFALNDLMKQVKDKPEEDVVKVMAIRSMAKAIYSTENIGHYGLSFDYYSHFTSPIRRYPDVMAHRLLEHYSNGGKSANKDDIEKKCVHSSNMEKKAADAERASIKYKQVEFMLDKIGEHFTGYVSGLTRWGMFVELEDTKVEGMIPLSSMDDDVYRFEEKKNRIIGTRYKEVYEFGDKVRIKVHGADLLMKQLDFRLV